MQASLILATYKQPRKLAAALYSLAHQSEKSFEILIADDGSDGDTRALIESFRGIFGERLQHHWQEDLGFRKARILNECIRQSHTQKLIFMDGDTCAHPSFVADHLEALEEADVFLGRRVMLGSSISRWLEDRPARLGGLVFFMRALFSSLFSGGDRRTRHLNRGLRLPARLRRLLKYDHVPDLIGCNFSARRAALVQVNGFDESHESYGNEDGDLYIRLRNSGARITGSKCYAVQWHLWHRERAFEPGAEAHYNERLRNDRVSVRCERGLEQVTN